MNTNFGKGNIWTDDDSDYDCEYYNHGAQVDSDPFCDHPEYDDNNFIAQLMCCECGGGENDLDFQGLTCSNSDNGALDTNNDDCTAYEDIPKACDWGYGDDDFEPTELCCTCGGGQNECRDLNVNDMWDSLAFACA